jgi:hypothetical protein
MARALSQQQQQAEVEAPNSSNGKMVAVDAVRLWGVCVALLGPQLMSRTRLAQAMLNVSGCNMMA